MADVPLSRRWIAALALVLAVLLVLAGRSLVRDRERAAEPRAPSALVRVRGAEQARVVVHIVGAVRRPGLYRVPRRARIADALARAGGATAKADLALVNLAAPVADGTQIVVPSRVAVAAARGATEAAASPGPAAGPVRLNSATFEQLDALPGVGPVTAQKILDYRQQNGAFSSIDELWTQQPALPRHRHGRVQVSRACVRLWPTPRTQRRLLHAYRRGQTTSGP